MTRSNRETCKSLGRDSIPSINPAFRGFHLFPCDAKHVPRPAIRDRGGTKIEPRSIDFLYSIPRLR